MYESEGEHLHHESAARPDGTGRMNNARMPLTSPVPAVRVGTVNVTPSHGVLGPDTPVLVLQEELVDLRMLRFASYGNMNLV